RLFKIRGWQSEPRTLRRRLVQILGTGTEVTWRLHRKSMPLLHDFMLQTNGSMHEKSAKGKLSKKLALCAWG
ncbi:MAG: hypothetical protein U5M53_04515, partial [Rhodoferax sp.]|nr:hypothetical protein [Rhodoferax sp.]